MRFLIISEHLPGDSHQHGVFQRLRTFSEALDRLGSLDFLFFVGPHKNTTPEETADFISEHWGIKKPRVFIERYGDDPGMSRFFPDYLLPATSMHRQAHYARMSGPEQVATIERYLEDKPDLVFAHRLGAMCPLLLTRQPAPPILFDLDDIEHKARARAIPMPPTWGLKRLLYLQLPALWIGERAAIRKADTTFVCSEKDRDYLQRTMRTGNIAALPNTSIPPPSIQPASSAPPHILFIGAYSYQPNALAADILIRDIWPQVRDRVPQARLIIAGARPDLIPAYQDAPDGVEFTGFVDDLHALYARTRVVCTPIQNGGGTRIKIIEAAMHARPVISTSIGAEGLELGHENGILIADKVDELAEQCIALLNDPGRCECSGMTAMQIAIQFYGREAVIRSIVCQAERLFKGDPASPGFE
ncbi:MAG: glycosyltransferase [Thiobacillus sp.]